MIMRSEGISYLRGSHDAVFDVRSRGQDVGVVWDVFRDLICDWSQDITEELKEHSKQGCDYFEICNLIQILKRHMKQTLGTLWASVLASLQSGSMDRHTRYSLNASSVLPSETRAWAFRTWPCWRAEDTWTHIHQTSTWKLEGYLFIIKLNQ